MLTWSVLDADHSDMAHAFSLGREMPLPSDWQREMKRNSFFKGKNIKQSLFGCQYDHVRLWDPWRETFRLDLVLGSELRCHAHNYDHWQSLNLLPSLLCLCCPGAASAAYLGFKLSIMILLYSSKMIKIHNRKKMPGGTKFVLDNCILLHVRTLHMSNTPNIP